MKTESSTGVAVAILLSTMAASHAQVPDLINYQGRLVDGTNLVNGQREIVFRIYDDATNELPSSLHYADTDTVSVVDGLYHTTIGDAGPGELSAALQGGERWLEVRVDGARMLPRERIASVPFAILAAGVTNAAIGFRNIARNGAASGQVIKWNGAAWHAADDLTSGGGTTDHGSLLGLDHDDHPQYLRSDAPDVYNESGVSRDLRFEGGNDPNLVFLDGSVDAVGIGTDTPGGKFQVTGDDVRIGDGVPAEASGDGDLYVEDLLEVGGFMHVAGDGRIGDGASGVGGTAEILEFAGQSESWYIGVQNETTPAESDFFIGKSQSEDGTLHIEQDGDVGIGTRNPEGRLHVEGTLVVQDFIQADDSTGLEIRTDDAVTRITMKDNGRIGIGTTDPGSILQVTGDDVRIGDGTPQEASGDGDLYVEDLLEVGNQMEVDGDARIGDGRVDYDGGGETLQISARTADWYVGVQNESLEANSGFFIGKNAYEDGVFHIENDGDVGIGTAEPKGKLHVEGAVVVQDFIRADDSTGLELQTDDAVTRMTIANSGNIGIGTTALPVGRLQVMQDEVRIGGGSPDRADDEGDLYVENELEVRGALYVDNNSEGAIYFGLGTANALLFSTNVFSFTRSLHVNGTLSKAAGSFKIDHPLDPANKTLSHSFVESPDMKNVYDGIVVLGGDSEAWVELPDWFEALNRDFRYQLTAIGAPGPNLHIAEKISGSRFRIAGGTPGQEVSWQITGIRKDAYANTYRIPVEEGKPAEEKGTYLHPELY